MGAARDPEGQDSRPTDVGRYRIVESLGSGGMGAVYLAYDPHNDQQVALKILARFAGESEDLRQRFNDEMRLPGGLLHPNVAAILEVAEWQGQPFVVMEYVPGQSLEQILGPRPPLPLARRIHLLDQLCQGLHCAHAAGIIHRDIKPANLMVTHDWVLKIVDFGIARLAETGVTHMTLAGTLGYMSPEQIEGRVVDHRSDIFSVGVVAYELLAFQRPFRGTTRERVMLETLAASPTPLDRLVDGLTSGLIDVVTRALARNPNDRFQDLEEMRVALRSASAELSDIALSEPLRSRSASGSDVSGDQSRTIDLSRTSTDHVEGADSAIEPATADRNTGEATLFAPLQRPSLRSSEERSLPPPPQVRVGFAKSIGQNVIITSCGLATSALTLFLLVSAETQYHVRVYMWFSFFLPTGSTLSGLMAASGYYLGALMARRRPTRPLLVNIVVAALATWCLVWYFHYRFGPLFTTVSFFEFVHSSLQQSKIKLFGFDAATGIVAGFVLVLLQILGFVFGGVLIFGLLRERPFCRRCQCYLSSPVVAKGFSAFDRELEAIYYQVRRFAAAGNPMAAVALIRALAREELSYQLVVTSWRCGGCANEYFQTLFLEHRAGQWVRREAHTFSQLTTAVIGGRSDPSEPENVELPHAEERPFVPIPFDRGSWSKRLARTMAIAALTAVILAGPSALFGLMPNMDAFAAAVKRIDALESDMRERYEKWLADKSAARQPFGDVLKAQVIPAWERERTSVASIPVPDEITAIQAKLVNYMDLKTTAWRYLASGLSANNLAHLKSWLVNEEAATALLESILQDLIRSGVRVSADAQSVLSARVASLRGIITATDALQAKVRLDAQQVTAFFEELRSMEALEQTTLAAYDDAIKRLRARQASSSEFADFVQRDVLARWNAERRRVSATVVPEPFSSFAMQIAEYMALRAEGWRLTAEGIRSNNVELVRQGNKKHADAAALTRAMNTINELQTSSRR